MVEGVLTELNEVLEPLSNPREIIQVKSDMFNRHLVEYLILQMFGHLRIQAICNRGVRDC